MDSPVDGERSAMVAGRGNRIERVPIAGAACGPKLVDADAEGVRVARSVGTILGDEPP